MFSIVVGYKYTICGCTLQWGILPILIRCRSKIWMNFNFFTHMGGAVLGVGVQSWSWRLGIWGRNRPLWVGATHGEATKPSGASAEESVRRSQGS